MRSLDRGFLFASLFTAALVLLVATAIADELGFLSGAVALACVGASVFFYLLFPGSRAFAVGLANGLAAYACIFAFFMETNFSGVGAWPRPLGFLLPVVAFMGGALWRRRTIRAIVTAAVPRQTQHPGRVLFWLLPLAVIGAVTYFLPPSWQQQTYDLVFLLAMAAIALVAAVLSPGISVFLLDSSLLFERFFLRLGALATAAFAFLSLYSLLVIVFGVVYRLLTIYTLNEHFLVNGVARDLTFPEALYFSLVTLATVGFGDIVPVSAAARVLVAGQIVVGVLLLLFGFAEIMRAAQGRERRDRPD